MVQPELLLASNSPRRREMLAWLGWNFTSSPPEIDESHLTGEPPAEYVLRLSAGKAQASAAQARANQVILAADTAVVEGDDLLGKPATPDEARAMLRRLRGRTHQVFTALAVIAPGGGQLLQDLCVSSVPMRDYTDEEIDRYIASGDPFDKAGGYAIQHPDFRPVENFSGCYASVMGLPLCHMERSLRKLAISSPRDVPRSCQSRLGYNCPIFAAVMRGERVG